MGDFLSDIISWMEQIPPLWAYAVILIVAYGENVIPPIPGDMIVVFGGYLVGVGRLEFVPVVIVASIGGALGFMTMYAVGRKIGEAVLNPDRVRWIPREQVQRAQAWLARWGYGVVAANRFLSGARSVISLTVGMARTDVWMTAFFATLSALVWTSLMSYGGLVLGENWPTIGTYLRTYGEIVLVAMGFVLLIFAVRFLLRRRGR